MTTQTQLRQAFIRDLSCLTDPTQNAWLIKGDFDHFKRINDLYGCLLADTILDWSIETIATALEDAQKRLEIGPTLWNVIGDDLTIYIPPSNLAKTDLASLLHRLRSAVWESFYQRYAVCALPFPVDFFADMPPLLLEAVKSDLEKQDIVMDFAPRRQGFLLLFPVALAGRRERLVDEVIAMIQRQIGKHSPATTAEWAWLYNQAEPACHTFNNGFIYPPSISFAGWSVHRLMLEQTGSQEDNLACFERLTCACQSTLKTCKQQQKEVLLNVGVAATRLESPTLATAVSVSGAFSRLSWFSERFLREKLYFRRPERSLLFQMNPVYRFASGVHAECTQMEKYHGNSHGLGLKGINELCGQDTANSVIQQLILVFTEALQAVLGTEGSFPTQLLTALFVDRITVFCEQPDLSHSEIIELGERLITIFNAGSNQIKVAHVRISVVESSSPLTGYMLLHWLALTQLSTTPAAVIFADDQLETRQFCQIAAQEGNLAIETNAFCSARQMEPANLSTTQTNRSRKIRG
jgi:GGDEF domain-containing protein